jgi:hypothetical protein
VEEVVQQPRVGLHARHALGDGPRGALLVEIEDLPPLLHNPECGPQGQERLARARLPVPGVYHALVEHAIDEHRRGLYALGYRLADELTAS